MCTPDGEPVTFTLWPASLHDLTPLHELTVLLPPEAKLFEDNRTLSTAKSEEPQGNLLRLIRGNERRYWIAVCRCPPQRAMGGACELCALHLAIAHPTNNSSYSSSNSLSHRCARIVC